MELIVRSDRELRRVERAIAELEARPAADRLRVQVLLQALMNERAELTRSRPSARPPMH
jgi:hypothetical protein